MQAHSNLSRAYPAHRVTAAAMDPDFRLPAHLPLVVVVVVVVVVILRRGLSGERVQPQGVSVVRLANQA